MRHLSFLESDFLEILNQISNMRNEDVMVEYQSERVHHRRYPNYASFPGEQLHAGHSTFELEIPIFFE
jgi:hypothetical protein